MRVFNGRSQMPLPNTFRLVAAGDIIRTTLTLTFFAIRNPCSRFFGDGFAV
jgi:hypothetical protein